MYDWLTGWLFCLMPDWLIGLLAGMSEKLIKKL